MNTNPNARAKERNMVSRQKQSNLLLLLAFYCLHINQQTNRAFIWPAQRVFYPFGCIGLEPPPPFVVFIGSIPRPVNVLNVLSPLRPLVHKKSLNLTLFIDVFNNNFTLSTSSHHHLYYQSIFNMPNK